MACLLAGAMLSQAAGCKSGPETLLKLYHDGKNTAEYGFDKTYWRPSPTIPGGVEIVGYGFIPFINNNMSPDYNPMWAPSGFVTFWIHGFPEADGKYNLKLLGPAKALGPGDDEVLSGIATHEITTSAKNDVRTITVSDVPIKSRNHPGENFTMSGVIIARPISDSEFDGKLKEFNQQLSYRGPLISN